MPIAPPTDATFSLHLTGTNKKTIEQGLARLCYLDDCPTPLPHLLLPKITNNLAVAFLVAFIVYNKLE